MKLLHKDSPLEEWEARAKELGLDGATLREQTLLADALIEEILKEEVTSQDQRH